VTNSIIIGISDALILFVSLVLGNLILYLMFSEPVSIKYSLLIIPIWWAGASVAGLFPGWGLDVVEEIKRIELSLIVLFGLAAFAYFFSRERVLPSRVVYAVSWLFSAFFLPVTRWFLRTLLARMNAWGCSVALYGRSQHLSQLISALQASPELGYVPRAVFTDDTPAGEAIHGVPVQGVLTETNRDIPVAAVTQPSFSDDRITQLVDHTLIGYKKIILFPDIREDVFLSVRSRSFGSLIGLEVASNLLNPFSRLLKRSMDVFLTLITLPIWGPLVALLILTVWRTDGGRPFFIQKRLGKNGRPFGMIKFRTMVPEADKKLEQELAKDASLREEWERNYKLKNDPRITRAGRLLRCFSLDELPQLINVLRGEMSLVGPRPLPVYHHEALSSVAQMPRNRVKPGITGLWQVSGRSDIDMTDMEEWDTYYVRNWSIWLDVVVLARTLGSVINSEGAY